MGIASHTVGLGRHLGSTTQLNSIVFMKHTSNLASYEVLYEHYLLGAFYNRSQHNIPSLISLFGVKVNLDQ